MIEMHDIYIYNSWKPPFKRYFLKQRSRIKQAIKNIPTTDSAPICLFSLYKILVNTSIL